MYLLIEKDHVVPVIAFDSLRAAIGCAICQVSNLDKPKLSMRPVGLALGTYARFAGEW